MKQKRNVNPHKIVGYRRLPPEFAAMAKRRVSSLISPEAAHLTLAHLLVEAYTQGIADAVDAMDRGAKA